MTSDSPFAQHLGSNYCPRDEELVQIKSLLIEPCLRLEHLDDEIEVLKKALDKLTEECDTLKGYVDAHRALMSPIRRLPLDTIEDIFMACLPADRNCVMTAQEAPVLLGRICSSWRAISLSQPQLWSRLHIVEPKRLELTTAWLRRSGDCPLSISLESHPGWSSPPSPLNTDSFIKALIPFSSRWRNIRLAVQSFALEALSRLTENDVPLLQDLEISLHYQDQTPFVPQPGGVLHGPSLTRFSFSGHNDNCLDLPLRWNQLTSLSVLFPAWDMGHLQTPQVALDILSKCPKLQICIFACPSLHSVDLLCLGEKPLHTVQCLLKHLSMANLQEFKIRGGKDLLIPSTVSTEDPLMLSLTAFPRLNSISINTETFSRQSLMYFVSALPPTIQSLHITEPVDPWQLRSEPVLDDEVLVTLAAHCPALRELTILNCHHATDDALLRFIIAGTPALRRIQVEFEREREVDICPSIQLFVDNGLECNTMYRSPFPPSPPPPPSPPLPRSSPWEGLPDALSAPNFQSF
ncbi:hypothetical protein K438DRAFT_1821456 [Mycena galopus ATCC 62051]|nr:hypothetical protein K438DRAFT_1821456 [Mycena galopus ATCC 62051]